MDETDIFISGGGIAGLTAAASLSARGWRVILADPAPPDGAATDTRSTAFLSPARRLFEEAGVWGELAHHATRLDVLRVIDTSGWPPVERTRREFAAFDLGEETFGWNVPNAVSRPALAKLLAVRAGVDLRLGTGFRGLLVRDREAIVALTDGSRISARLVVAADGHASPVREAAGIGVSITRYGQRALAFAVTHPEPHRNASTEIYNSGGAFTLVPLPDRDGRHASAVVWMLDGPDAARLAEQGAEAISDEATTRSGAILGPLTVASQCRQLADHHPSRRSLDGPAGRPRRRGGARHAAHRRAGSQHLAHRCRRAGAGARSAMTRVQRRASPPMRMRRHGDVRARAMAIDVFNRVCRSGAPAIRALRSAGLSATHDFPSLRRAVMQAGLGRR